MQQSKKSSSNFVGKREIKTINLLLFAILNSLINGQPAGHNRETSGTPTGI
jgi:hypothetical protein